MLARYFRLPDRRVAGVLEEVAMTEPANRAHRINLRAEIVSVSPRYTKPRQLTGGYEMAAPRSGIKKIVVGVDGSEHSEAAIDWAARMAKGMGSEVIAVFAISPPVYFDTGYMTPVPPPQFDPEWRAEMKKEFERDWCKRLSKAGVKYRTVFEDGRPSNVINQVADRVNADLIVVGRRGRGGVAELVLGSVSHQLVLHSKRPVLVIEAAPRKATRRAAATTRKRKPVNSKAPATGTKRTTR